MTKKTLKQYNDLNNEIKHLEKRIEKVSKIQTQHDRVTGSSQSFPYQMRSFKVEGYHTDDVDRLNKLKLILVERKERCDNLKIEIEEFIASIPDSQTRLVFELRYIHRLNWQAIAMRIGKVHESYPRKEVHDKYLESL